jgi:hypothetical protein
MAGHSGYWTILHRCVQMGPGTAAQDAVLYKPVPAIRVRWNMNPDTPLPGDEPAGENPPDGAVIDYYLKGDATAPVTLEIADAAGRVLHRFSSTDTLYDVPDVNIPLIGSGLNRSCLPRPGRTGLSGTCMSSR